MATKYEIKNLINSMVNAVETASTTMGLNEGAGKAARYELAMFMMYLSASDGEIKWDEASMISDLCDLSLTPQTLSSFIRENNIYSTEFERKTPITLKIMVTMDNKLMEMNLGNNIDDIPSLIVNTYKTVAEMIMNSDDDVDFNEKGDCQIYLDMLENYINDNSIRRKTSISGFVKNTDDIIAPTKSGVSAPKKKG